MITESYDDNVTVYSAFDTCPDCLVGDIQPNGNGYRCTYCGAAYIVTPSEALKDEYWAPVRCECGGTMSYSLDIIDPDGTHPVLVCDRCGLGVVR